MRILYVIENIFFGGGESVFAQLINSLGKEGFQVWAACRSGGAFEQRVSGRAKIIPFDMRGALSLSKVAGLASIIRQNKIDLVHSQGGRADFFARIAAKLSGVPVVSTIAAPVEEYEVGRLRKAVYISLDRFSEKFVSRFIVVSEALRRVLTEKHRIPEDKIVKVHNGIDAADYASRPEVIARLREEFGVKTGAKLIAVVGRLAQVKGIGYFIQAIKQMTADDRQRNICALIVGDGPLRGELEDLVERLGLKDIVRFTGFRNDIKDILSALDILVLPSIREGQPMVVLEAMASGLVVVASRIEGIEEVIEDGVTGILAAAKSPAALAREIVGVLGDDEASERIRRQAKASVEERFDLEDMVAKHQDIYTQLLKKPAGMT
ncbi:glycosyltransferase family 4 protein [Candidatus Omnitrophota bacterium]